MEYKNPKLFSGYFWNKKKFTILCLLQLLFLLPQISIASEKNKLLQSYQFDRHKRIAQCVAGPNNESFYTMSFNYSNKDGFSSSFQLQYLKAHQGAILFDLPIPLDTIPNPYLYTEQVRLFQLIDQRYLYIAVQHLDGTVFFCVVDTQPPVSVIRSMKLQPPAGSVLLLDKHGVFSILSKNSQDGFSYMTLDRHGRIKQQTKISAGQQIDGTLSCATLLDDGAIVAASTTATQEKTVSTLYRINNAGEITKRATREGIVFKLFAADNQSVFGLRTLDEKGNSTEAFLLDQDLSTRQRYDLPSVYELLDPTSSLMVGSQSTLFLGTINMQEGESGQFTIHVFQGGKSQSTVLYDVTGNNSFLIDSFLFKSKNNELFAAISLLNTDNEQTALQFLNIDTGTTYPQ